MYYLDRKCYQSQTKLLDWYYSKHLLICAIQLSLCEIVVSNFFSLTLKNLSLKKPALVYNMFFYHSLLKAHIINTCYSISDFKSGTFLIWKSNSICPNAFPCKKKKRWKPKPQQTNITSFIGYFSYNQCKNAVCCLSLVCTYLFIHTHTHTHNIFRWFFFPNLGLLAIQSYIYIFHWLGFLTCELIYLRNTLELSFQASKPEQIEELQFIWCLVINYIHFVFSSAIWFIHHPK